MTITTETDLSIQYKVLRTLIRPLRPRLVHPGKPLPAGSPRLSKAPNSKSGVKVQERQECDVWLYDFRPPGWSSSANYDKNIYYFAGGAYQMAPSGGHWGLCARFAKNLIESGYTLTLVSYPLAPNTPAKESLPILRKWLKAVMSKAVQEGRTVQLMGDSAGGNVVLSLAFWWAQEYHSTSPHTELETVPHPEPPTNPLTDVIVISPATDLRHENPDMKEADKLDPILTIESTTKCGKLWAEGLGTSDPYVSAVLTKPETFAQLRDSGVKIHGIVGTADVLAADALLFQKLCNENGVKGDWLIWEGQMHCFPLIGAYGITEGKKSLDWIENLLRNCADKTVTSYEVPKDSEKAGQTVNNETSIHVQS